MDKLSVVIITYNEERNIARCIQSVKNIADEIIVVDSFSTDRTLEIAGALGATIFQNTFSGHVNQKNFALKLASYPLILSLDADEAVDDNLAISILKVKKEGMKKGYTMNRLNNYCGQWIKHGAWYPDIKLRLIRKGSANWGGMNPHDRLELINAEKTVHLNGNILHYSYQSFQEHLIKSSRYAEIGAGSYKAVGKKGYWHQVIYKPIFKFIRDYFIKLGFLDGLNGFIIALINSREVLLKYFFLLRNQ